MFQYSKSLDQLRAELSELDQRNLNFCIRLEKSVELIKAAREDLKVRVRKNGFHSIEDEIHFFKHIKPTLISMLIVHATRLAAETVRSSYSRKDFKVLIKKKLNFIQAHFIEFPEFVTYLNSESTSRDHFYFLRNSRFTPLIFTGPYDSDFSTGYDIISAHAHAFNELNNYFQKSTTDTNQNEQLLTNIKWVAPKVALVELVYALHESGSVTLGKNDLIELSRSLGKVFNIEMPDVYRMFNEIRGRKKDKCRFLRQLIHVLQSKMEQMDELKSPN